MDNQQRNNTVREFPIHLRMPQYKRIKKIMDESGDVKTFLI